MTSGRPAHRLVGCKSHPPSSASGKASDRGQGVCGCPRSRAAPSPAPFIRPATHRRPHSKTCRTTRATAQYCIECETPHIQRRGFFEAEELTPSNWADALLARRAAFIEDWRSCDAAEAREALAAVWVTRSADERIRLLGAVQTSLSKDDLASQEPPKKDRAPRVRARDFHTAILV